ncbi:hypothetical protein [Salinimicrobium sp. HB62]|uniref:hypothetical protein n=1 Tax=Salinimicrobium sp. HB62 TaxID=3077781 RepID=UPI002D77133F|nr:hypothetical protein [Salinimicrobium sp. HB62]
MSAGTKQKLIDACEVYVEKKLQTFQAAIDDLQAALKLETKCSMGDKYETGRAMLHLEFEKLAVQHEEFQKLRKTLRKIPPSRKDTTATFGSGVRTSMANYFIGIPAGEILIEGEKFYSVGATAPIAKILTGRSTGDRIHFNNREIEILEVF